MTGATPRMVAFGELLLRLSPPGQERLLQSPELRASFGGSEANVAISLAHFGLESEFVTQLPSNPIGDAALRALRAEGVATGAVVRGGDRMGIYFVEPGAELRPMRVVYDRAGSSFSRLEPGAIDWPGLLEHADWLHWSGITPALGDRARACTEEAIAAARAAGLPISVDLNYRPALWAGRDPAAVIRPLVAAAHLLICNVAAAQAMLGAPAGDASVVAGLLAREHGCSWVAVTEREQRSASEHKWGATLHDGAANESFASTRHRVRVVDRVGGGDAFAAGMIYGLATGRPSHSALEFATAAGALKLTIPGDFNRVSAAEVDAVLAAPGRPTCEQTPVAPRSSHLNRA